jgi:hypothetical protein
MRNAVFKVVRWRAVQDKFTDVSQEHIACFFRVEEWGEQANREATNSITAPVTLGPSTWRPYVSLKYR